jgi:hypothetical protein
MILAVKVAFKIDLSFFGGLMRTTLRTRIYGRVSKSRRILHVDTQRTRRRLIVQLESVFQIASNYARGEVCSVTGDDGKPRPLTVAEKQFWARIAAHSAQTINNLAKGLDERQVDLDLDWLEGMLNQASSTVKSQASSGSAGKAEERSAGASGQPVGGSGTSK